MTAEVVAWNRSAIALAADSAVTVANRRGETAKIYMSGKLFAFSKCEPIGVMVYGSAELTGIPWETLIKVYREEELTAR